MMRKVLSLATILSLFGSAAACTIGVASGAATADGRPLVWKTRDSSGENNGLHYVNDESYRYIAVVDAGEPGVWMGVNEHGFGILNSYSSDLAETRFGNGELMRRAVAQCASIEEFQAMLDLTNSSGRQTLGNFGVIDAAGGASIFEVGAYSYERFDADDNGGWLVRANFSISGGGTTGTARYQRANEIVGSLAAGDSLRHDTLARTFLRDLSNSEAQPYAPPFMQQWAPGRPFGYIDADWSICSNTTVSAAVIQGVLPGEPAWLSTLWAMPGNPFATVLLPFWPLCEAPPAAKVGGMGSPSPLTSRAITVRQQLFDYPLEAAWLDTWKLMYDNGDGWLRELQGLEHGINVAAEMVMTTWRINPPDSLMMYEATDSLANIALSVLDEAGPPTAPVAGFSASVTQGEAPLTVQFTDQSLHQPVTWAWDFNSDGVVDSELMNPSHTFSSPGVYSVTLVVDGGTDSAVADSMIVVASEFEEQQRWMRSPSPNPFTRQAVIDYSLPRETHVRMRVYNVRGQRVATLVDEVRPKGENTAVWAPRLMHSGHISAGVYFVRLEADGWTETKKMVFIP